MTLSATRFGPGDYDAETVVARGADWVLLAPPPPGPLADAAAVFVARTRHSLHVACGGADAQQRVLGHRIHRDRLCVALLRGKLVGALSYRCDGRGALCPEWRRFRAEYGRMSGAWRYVLTLATLHRGRARDLYIEGYALLPVARGRGIGAAMLAWLGTEVARRQKSGWRTEMPATAQAAALAYTRAGALPLRTVRLGPFGRLVGARTFTIYRWTPPG